MLSKIIYPFKKINDLYFYSQFNRSLIDMVFGFATGCIYTSYMIHEKLIEFAEDNVILILNDTPYRLIEVGELFLRIKP